MLGVAMGLAGAARAQVDDAPPPPDATIEQYLEDRGLIELLAVHLLDRLRTADGDARVKLADRLGSMYVQLLDKATTPEARHLWESKSQELLKAVPEADSSELRLNLAKARYLHAEDIAERARLRLASADERQEAETTLHSVYSVFQDIGNKINKRVEALEKAEANGRDEDAATVRTKLAEARRLRSLAMYYAGWSQYYTVFLAGKGNVEEALSHFGWLLNAAGGRPANVERLPAALLRYEHVARAALGCALCESLRNHDGAAILWLDAVDNAEGVAPVIKKQILSRRIAVYSQAKRWAVLESLIKHRRQPEAGKPPQPLDTGEARLLAVLTLETLDDRALPKAGRELVQSLADLAITDLITRGEVHHVQDLVSKYGSAELGGEGFIVQYVRGLQSYDRARAAHTAAGENTEEPANDDSVRNLYRQAGHSLEISLKSEDASRFSDERANAGLMLGLSSFYAGDLEKAAGEFEECYRSDTSEGQGGPAAKRSEDALWLAIVALDKGVEGGNNLLKDRLARLTTLFLKTFPKSDRAAKLLLRQAAVDLVSEDKAVAVLLGVDAKSPLYESARRQAASLLYNIYRKAHGSDRDFAALRFAEVSEELLRVDGRKLTQGTEAERAEAASQLIVRVRQELDAVLGMTAPDLDRAQAAFQQLDTLVADAGLDLRKVEDELTYRRLQVALARGKPEDVTKLLDHLHALGGRYSDAADRLLYKRALAELSTPNPPALFAENVVRYGQRVMDQFGRDAKALADPAVYALHNAVADAAARVWDAKHDEAMRDLSLAIDRNLMNNGNPPLQVLHRFAVLAEGAGDTQGALDAWRSLVSGLNPTSPDWFEARFNSIRLLLAKDPAGARAAMNQYRVLHQDFGPDPWGSRLKELDEKIPAQPPETPK
jgi:hypothetical protein